jgi:hypothetical protein
MNTMLMVNPCQLADGDHAVFVSGNGPEARALVTRLRTFGAVR